LILVGALHFVERKQLSDARTMNMQHAFFSRSPSMNLGSSGFFSLTTGWYSIESLRGILQSEGYLVDTAETGLGALEKAEAQFYS